MIQTRPQTVAACSQAGASALVVIVMLASVLLVFLHFSQRFLHNGRFAAALANVEFSGEQSYAMTFIPLHDEDMCALTPMLTGYQVLNAGAFPVEVLRVTQPNQSLTLSPPGPGDWTFLGISTGREIVMLGYNIKQLGPPLPGTHIRYPMHVTPFGYYRRNPGNIVDFPKNADFYVEADAALNPIACYHALSSRNLCIESGRTYDSTRIPRCQ